MRALFVRCLGWLGGLAVGSFSGWRALFLVTFLSYLGTMLYNFLFDFCEEIFNFIFAQFDSVTSSVNGLGISAQVFTGLTGYFLVHLRVLEALSFVVTVVLTKWTLRLISGLVPFVNM